MKMGRLEKLFVNRAANAHSVARQQIALLHLAGAQPRQRYLDVGCGNGLATMEVARELGLEVTGVDIDPEQIEIARKHSRGMTNAAFLLHDGARLPFSADYFAIVGSFNTTHHIPEWQDALCEMVRVLRPEGFLVYSDFMVAPWVAGLGRFLVGRRASLPTQAGLLSLIEKQGLSERHWEKSWARCRAVLQKKGA